MNKLKELQEQEELLKLEIVNKEIELVKKYKDLLEYVLDTKPHHSEEVKTTLFYIMGWEPSRPFIDYLSIQMKINSIEQELNEMGVS